MTRPLADIAPIRRETLGERVYVTLRDRLAAGEIAPGEALSLRSLAQTLGVSMMPVRDAVTRLVADDALQVLPSRSVRVPEMTLAEFRDLTTVRLMVEGAAAERAALVRTKADLAAIDRQVEAFRGAATAPDMPAAVRANRDLHFAVYAAAGLPPLTAIVEGLWLRIGPVLNYDMRSSPQRLANSGARDCHARLAAAVRASDPGAARRALTDDIEAAAAFIERTGRLPG